MTSRLKKKAGRCWGKKKLLADELTLNSGTKAEFLVGLRNSERLLQEQHRKLNRCHKNFIGLLTELNELHAAYEEQSKELETAYKDRNEAIRRYNALHSLGRFAESEGVDLTKKLPENQKNKYKFSIDGKVLESGKTAYTATLEKKQSLNGRDLMKNKKNGKK